MFNLKLRVNKQIYSYYTFGVMVPALLLGGCLLAGVWKASNFFVAVLDSDLEVVFATFNLDLDTLVALL